MRAVTANGRTAAGRAGNGRTTAAQAGGGKTAPGREATGGNGSAGQAAGDRAQDGEHSCYLVQGQDQSLIDQAASAILHKLAGDGDPSQVVEEHGAPGAGGIDVGRLVDALTTPSLFGDRRIVVVRQAGQLGASGAETISGLVADLPPGTVLVLVGGGKAIPAALKKATERHGTIVDTSVGRGRERSRWFQERVTANGLHLEPAAVNSIETTLGEDLPRLEGLLASLLATYGPRQKITAADVAQFTGSLGAVPPWELTDAISSGSTTMAITALRRLVRAGGMHPLGIIAVLHRYFEQILLLDGSMVSSGQEAAAILGVKSTFVAEKALKNCRRLGSTEVIARAISLLSQADLDLRGASGLAPELVAEILVARLARLVPADAGRAAGRPPRYSRRA